jgi:hypothetical protein
MRFIKHNIWIWIGPHLVWLFVFVEDGGLGLTQECAAAWGGENASTSYKGVLL